jgi:protein-disulfide isomerase
MEGRFDRVLSVLLVICAIAVTATVVRREFAPSAPVAALPPLDRPTRTDAWNEVLATGIEIGNRAAPVKVVEFADLECPFCAKFHEEMLAVMKAHPNDVSVVFVHFPLVSHRFALQAARAVECADTRGRVSDLISDLYKKQDSIGIKSWGEFAQEAGIADTAAFRKCAVDPTPVKRIESGKAVGSKIHVSSTPTVLINGWRYGRAPDRIELAQIVQTILSGGSPGDSTSKTSR